MPFLSSFAATIICRLAFWYVLVEVISRLALKPMNIEQWLAQYGYFAVFFGVFLEGPLTLAMAGFLAHQGYLNVAGIFLAGLAATFLMVEALYFVGLVAGKYLLAKWPLWRRHHAGFSDMLRRHEALFILGFRFILGAQVMASMAIGMGRVRPGHFSALNAAGAALWVAVMLCVGYFFGHAFEMLIEDIKTYEKPISLALAAAVLVYYLARRVIWRRVAGKKR